MSDIILFFLYEHQGLSAILRWVIIAVFVAALLYMMSLAGPYIYEGDSGKRIKLFIVIVITSYMSWAVTTANSVSDTIRNIPNMSADYKKLKLAEESSNFATIEALADRWKTITSSEQIFLLRSALSKTESGSDAHAKIQAAMEDTGGIMPVSNYLHLIHLANMQESQK